MPAISGEFEKGKREEEITGSNRGVGGTCGIGKELNQGCFLISSMVILSSGLTVNIFEIKS